VRFARSSFRASTYGQRYDRRIRGAGADLRRWPRWLALAIELGSRGVECVLVEQGDGTVPVPKMSQLSTRTMEFCRRWGIADQTKKAGWPEEHPADFIYVTNMIGYELFRQKFAPYAKQGDLGYTPEGPRQCPQIFFDPILLRHAASLPSVTLRHRTRLESFAEDANGAVKLGYGYEGSPIIWPDETKAQTVKDGKFTLSCRSGSRAPHAWLSENTSTLDLFGDGFVLLRFGRNIDASSLVAAAADRGVPLKVVDIDNRDIAALYERKLVLVRPDGHVAWREDACPDNASALIDRVRGAGSA